MSVSNERWWEFHHPTFTDAYRIWLSGQPEMLGEYLDSTPIRDLFRAVTCGDVGLEGALVVPSSLQGRVLDRLPAKPDGTGQPERHEWKYSLWPFLTRRCDKEFLLEVAKQRPEIVQETFRIGLYLSAFTMERSLAHRFLDVGAVGDPERLRIVGSLERIALSGEGGEIFNDSEWRRFLTGEELRQLEERVRSELIPQLDSLIADRLSELDSDDASIVSELVRSLEGYEYEFQDEQTLDVFERARNEIDEFEVVDPDREPDDDWIRESRRDSSSGDDVAPGSRSMFDDLAD